MIDKVLFSIRLLLVLIAIIVVCMIALDAIAEDVKTVKIVQAHGGLNVREAPCLDADAVYLLEDTETVIVLKERNGWALVAKNVSEEMVLGWVCADYLK